MLEYNITYRQKDKGWQYIISYKISGSWRQKTKQGFKTKKDAKPVAERAAKELELKLEAEENIIDTNYDTITFEQLFKAYLEHEKIYKEYSTTKGYKNAFACFSGLKNEKVMDIKKMNIVSCIDKAMVKKLKFETIRSYVRRIKGAFNYYIEYYDPSYINPTIGLKLLDDKDTIERKALNKTDLDSLLKNLKGNKFFIVAYIAANTGLRCGEVLGLTLNDIDFINHTISVNKQWKVLKNGHSGMGSLKTKNSNRIVPISPKTSKYLQSYLRHSVIGIDGRIAPFNKSSIEKYLNPELQRLAGISMHNLRHTYATLLIGNGVDFKTLAKLLGHTVEMTLRIYSHVNDDMMKNATDKIRKIF